MKIAVLGCGAIGGLFLGYLSRKGADVAGVARDYQLEALAKDGLTIEGVNGDHTISVKSGIQVKEKVDLAIFATKINDLREVIETNHQFLNKAFLLTTQNGVAADYILSEYFDKEKIITGIVMFGATFYSPNKVVHNFPGNLLIGTMFDQSTAGLSNVRAGLKEAFEVVELENIKGAKYLKVFINLNNCIPAILGRSMQEVFGDLELANLAIQINREAFKVTTKSNISLESLPTYPKERIQGLVNMPLNEAAGLFSKIMTGLSKEPLYGSILQSIKRGRKSEIDFINGEIVRLARDNDCSAPLNEKIVELVHQVEETGEFLTKDQLLDKYVGADGCRPSKKGA